MKINEYLYNLLKDLGDVYYYFPLEEITIPYFCITEISNDTNFLTNFSLERKRFQIDYYSDTAEDCLEIQDKLIEKFKSVYDINNRYIEVIGSKLEKEGDLWRLIFEIYIHFRR